MTNKEQSLVFVGPIVNPACANLRNALCSACNNSIQRITIYISSMGGGTLDGISMYNFIKALPVEVIMHNIGSIGSIANIVFLSGTKRYAANSSSFFFHDLSWGLDGKQDLVRPQLREPIALLDNDASRFVSIFNRETSLTEKDFKKMQLLDKPVLIAPGRAKEMGIVHEVQDPQHTAGIDIFNIVF